DRRARFRAQALPAQGRHDLHLRAHHPASFVAPAGPVREEGDVTNAAASLPDHPATLALTRRHRLRWWEALPWIAAVAFYFAFPDYPGFGPGVPIPILFALSLALALGYAGIIPLGPAAFFGAGAYTVGLLAFHGLWTEPITGLIFAALVAAAIGFASGL